ncbi:hypothetical protein HK100_003965 [Physocladia obscura]|uniref:Methyltransferase domain-containing protein n=1 Tax=Physocladia obscura TaxID=109957 RepID=A0AAD5SZB5_9FUNG|nr:hypothetical protein HK100_003965 [Physocladia obscura]
MGPNQSNTIKSALTASVQTNQISINSPQLPVSSAASKSASAAELAAAKINKLQAKVWNPNSPESWEPDMRGYHAVKGSDYTLPSDVIEQNRLELQHHIFRARFEGDIVCPEAKELVQLDGSKILDVGCAKGFWLESVRKENPFSEYHGVDIAENLATELSGNEPINIKFGNVLDRLPCEKFFYFHR